ncbi:MAG: hypothetical protein ABW032_05745 [Burkholderiaceae bacterium]
MAQSKDRYLAASGQVIITAPSAQAACTQVAQNYHDHSVSTCPDGSKPATWGVLGDGASPDHFSCDVAETNCPDNGPDPWRYAYSTFVSPICPDPLTLWSGQWVGSSPICWKYGDRYYNKSKEETCIPCLMSGDTPLDSNPGLGNPIYPLTGAKRQEVDLGFTIGGQPVTLTYDTSTRLPEAGGNATWLAPAPASFGPLWQSNLHKSLVLQSAADAGAAYSSVAVNRGGMILNTASVSGSDTCTKAGGGSDDYLSTVNRNERIQLTGQGFAGRLVDGMRLTEESYDESGAVTSLAQARGGSLHFTYTSGLLTAVTDQFGRSVRFAYEQPADGTFLQRINAITAPDGSTIAAGYDAHDNLQTLKWADGQVRTFVYGMPTPSWALTGIVDERGQRYGTYGYDSAGRANSTALGSGVDKYSVTYATAPFWSVTQVVDGNFVCREHRWQPPTGTQVTTPNGQRINLTAASENGMVSVHSQDQPSGSGSAMSVASQTYDAAGNIASDDTFNGNRACFRYDPVRNLPIVSLEGLQGGVSGKACPSDLANYAPSTADPAHPERKTTVAWHPDWVLKIREAEPKKLTVQVYNGQPDPFTGTTASCAPSTALLPDGKPIAVLCTRYEQATTDATGASGLAAALTGARRAWSYTYNAFGQVLTATTPKQSPTDPLSHTTTYTYYPTTSLSGGVGHTMGDLATMTNPLGQVTTYTSYDAAGRLLASTDANATVTAQTYWPRGWLQSQTVTPASGTALTTNYAYWPTGLLKTVTLPDASALSYAYDAAHRLTDVTDGAGNQVHYVLDNAGNRTSEQLRDASGMLAGTIARVYDNLNRVQTTIGAVQ